MALSLSKWQSDRSRLIALAGTGVAILALLANLDFFFRAGTDEVLTGLAYSGFVLAWMLVLTSGSRTVSLPTLGVYWLLGVWAVVGLSYLGQQALIGVSGVERSDNVVGVWYASITEEALKPLAVALYFVLAARRQHRWPSISDGLLLGFVVGWGLKFHEDAHINIVTGHGWDAASPWTTFFPTTELWNTLLYNDHAVRGALEGLSVGAAAMLWHWQQRRVAVLTGLVGPMIMFWGHVKWNYFASHPGEITGDAPFLYATLRDLLDGGRLPVLVLLVGAFAAVIAESMILRWVGKRDRIFPSLPVGQVLSRLKGLDVVSQLKLLAAADGYWRLRREVYYAAWRTRKAGGAPGFNQADAAALMSTAGSFGLLERPSREEGTTAPAVIPEGDASVEQAPRVVWPLTPRLEAMTPRRRR